MPRSGDRLPQATQKGGMAAGKEAAERQKKHTECAVPTGTNFLRSGKFQKVLILFVVRCYFGALIRGLENLEAPCEGERIVTFCGVQKVTKNTLGRAKSCQWQVFVRRRPPKQGELRTDVSKATMFQGDRGLRPSGLPGTIQISARYMIFTKMTGVHQVTGCAGKHNLSGYRR